MAKAQERDLSRIGWLDYLLMGICSCLAVYSGGMSIEQPMIGLFSVGLVLIGTLTSYIIRIQLLKSQFIKWDGLLYSAAVISSIYFAGPLAQLMPEGGFPREIAAAGWLSWMLILGSFATWQDSTLLFQAIPALALFGLVGCYDTYRAVTFNFFAFLICLATLFARAHGRQMLRQAALSGYFTRGLAPGTPVPSVETTHGLARRLTDGPWRWIAGPEWALLSALAVVLLSLLGAPIIRESVSGVAGIVTLPPPPIKNQPPSSSARSVQSDGVVRIGRGPNHQSPRPVIEAKLDKKRYLREQSFMSYTGSGWQNPPVPFSTSQDQETPTDIANIQVLKENTFNFEITLLEQLKYLPLPPEVKTVEADHGGALTSYDGAVQISIVEPYSTKVSGQSFEPGSGLQPKDAVRNVGNTKLLDLANIPARVTKLALDVTAGDKTDFDKAQSIEREITRRIVYNLEVEASPSGQDPVEWALFEKHEAYCDIYASAMVLMARAVGIPARYVQGYLPDDRRLESNGNFLISNKDYHAWAELMFKDVGWVIFDPTIGASAKEGEGLGDAGASQPWFSLGPVALAFDAAILLTVIAIIGLLSRVVKWRLPISNSRSEVERCYIRFVKRLERANGHRRHVGQTADEFLESVRPSLGSTFGVARELNEQFVRLLYASDTVATDGVQQVRKDLEAFIKMLKAEPKRPKGEV